MIEKQIVEILAPLADKVIDLEKRLASIPEPKEPAPVDVEAIARKAAELVPAPADGKDAPAVDLDEVAAKAAALIPAPRDGRDADPVDVEAIAQKAASLVPVPEPVAGRDGLPGERGEKGDPGEMVPAAAVVEHLKADPFLWGMLRGVSLKSVSLIGDQTLQFELDDGALFDVDLPHGPQGEPGPAGQDGVRGEKGVDGLGIETKAWTPGVYREGSFAMADLGRIYKAVRDTASAPGSDEWERVGSFGFAWKGLKQADAVYQDGDLYVDGGSAFLWMNGKGNLFCQKGARGATGERGTDGRAGADAPSIVHIRMTTKAVEVVMSNGDVLEAEFEGVHKSINDIVDFKMLNWLEADAQQIVDEGGTPLRSFRGQFLYGNSYKVGDVIVFNKSLWVAKKANRKEFLEDDWRKVYSGGGSGMQTPSFTGLVNTGGDMDLSVHKLSDAAFPVYRAVDKKWELNYVDRFATNPLSPFSAADDFHVPTSQNVQQYVDLVGDLLEDKITALQSGVQHQIGVEAIANAPPAVPAPQEGDRYIVGTVPTGAFLGHVNEIAEFVGGAWVFQQPSTGDAHYVDDVAVTFIWNGTTWVPLPRQERTSLQATAPVNALPGDCWLDNSGTKLQIKYWDGSSWITEAGTKTFTGPTDPATVPSNGVKDGDVWVQTFPAVGTPPVAPTPMTQVRQAGAWTNTTPSIPASSRVYYQNTQPVGATLGDIWVDGSKSKLQVSYFDGTAWQNEAGTKTFTQVTDPALLTTVVLQDGDVWVQTFPADATGHIPTPVTHVRQGGGWTITTPTVPASSRTFIQHAQPSGSVLGDQWIDLTGVKPEVQYYDGHAWVNSGGTRSFTSPTDPKLVTTNVIHEGDIWTDNTDPKAPKIYQQTGGAWVQMNAGGATFVPEAPPALTRGIWSRFLHFNMPPAQLFGGEFTHSTEECSFAVQKKPEFCPVPAKYKTGNDWFKITVWFDTSLQYPDLINPSLSFNFANGNWYVDQSDIPKLSVSRFTSSRTYFCRGDATALFWFSCGIYKVAGKTAGNIDMQIENVLVTWELLTIS